MRALQQDKFLVLLQSPHHFPFRLQGVFQPVQLRQNRTVKDLILARDQNSPQELGLHLKFCLDGAAETLFKALDNPALPAVGKRLGCAHLNCFFSC